MEKNEKKSNDFTCYTGSFLLINREYVNKMGKSFSEAVQDLCDVIVSTDVYKNYVEKRETVVKNPDVKEKVDRIRQLNFQLQTENNSDVAREELEKLEAIYDELSEDRRVFDYIQAESEIVNLYQEANKRILDKLELI